MNCKKKGKALHYQRAMFLTQKEFLEQLQGENLNKNNVPLIYSLPSGNHQKRTKKRLKSGLRSFRHKTKVEKAVATCNGRCQYFCYQNQWQRRQKLALQSRNPFLLMDGMKF
ncbi:TPA: hypothetical protein ACRZ4F_005632 [Vibrio harveyi]